MSARKRVTPNDFADWTSVLCWAVPGLGLAVAFLTFVVCLHLPGWAVIPVVVTVASAGAFLLVWLIVDAVRLYRLSRRVSPRSIRDPSEPPSLLEEVAVTIQEEQTGRRVPGWTGTRWHGWLLWVALAFGWSSVALEVAVFAWAADDMDWREDWSIILRISLCILIYALGWVAVTHRAVRLRLVRWRSLRCAARRGLDTDRRRPGEAPDVDWTTPLLSRKRRDDLLRRKKEAADNPPPA
jgi:hypothetical protein